MESREARLISGKGRFVDDLDFQNMASLVFVGSPYAHAKIVSLDVAEALAVPGVLRVITGREIVERTHPLPRQADLRRPGWTWRFADVYALAVDRVRWYGDPVAAVVAEDEYTAKKAAELIAVEYEPLPVVGSPEEAMRPDAPLIYDGWEDNKQAHLIFDLGDVDGAFAEADQVLKVRYAEGRASAFPLEARGFVAQYDSCLETLTIWGTFQTPFLARHNIAEVLGLPQAKVKTIATDIGGAFGTKIHAWKESVVGLAAILTGRPVKWFEPQRDWFVTGPHQRDVRWEGEVAVRNDGRVLGLKATVVHDLGVESTNKGIAALSIFPACVALPNAYRFKGIHVEGLGMVTNKSFYCAYRGYGKDKAIKFVEHAMDQVARTLGMTPEEIRFKNFIQPDEFPYSQINNYTYDSGDYPATLNKAIEISELASWRARQQELRRAGRHIGIGVAVTIEPAGVAVPNSQMGGITQARVMITPDGTVEVHSDRTEIGQGAEKSHAIIVSDILGCRMEDVLVHPVTSDWIGQGPLSSRGAVYPASAVAKAAKLLKKKVLACAATFLETEPDDIELRDGCVSSAKNPDKRLSYRELAKKSYFFPGPRALDEGSLLGHDHLLDVSTTWFSPSTAQTGSTYTTFCSSADIAVVEVDVETGVTEIKKYFHVHDAGTIIDRQIVDGQIHGGIVQGIGEALYEELLYDEAGILQNTCYSTYLIPTCADSPDIVVAHLETPSPYTETGSKGMGEAPIVGGKAVVLAAIEDALAPFGVEVNDSPATPERVRRWLDEAGQAGQEVGSIQDA